MSDDVMRFDLEGDVLGPTIQPVENGQYVQYEDYQQLVIKLSSCQERLQRLYDERDHYRDQCQDQQLRLNMIADRLSEHHLSAQEQLALARESRAVERRGTTVEVPALPHDYEPGPPVSQEGYQRAQDAYKSIGEPVAPHPEHTCGDCGGPNIVWFANNDLWNRVMGDEGGILCPVCFAKRAEAMGLNGSAWELRQEADSEKPCPTCGGDGEGQTDGSYSDIPLCQTCKGSGRVSDRRMP